MTTKLIEQGWAIRIGKFNNSSPYFLMRKVGDTYHPMVFETRTEAREYKQTNGNYYTDTHHHVVRVEVREL